MNKRIIAFTLSLLMIITAFSVYADGEIMQSYVVLGIGRDESELCVTWYADIEGEAEIRYAKMTELEGSAMPDDAMSVPATGDIADEGEGYYMYRGVMTGLEPSTRYVYQLVNEGYLGELRYFTTSDADSFSFAFAGDAQLGSGESLDADTEGWENTLSVIFENEEFAGSDFILSAGDQVDSCDDETHYGAFINREGMDSIPLATVIGNHDTDSPLYSYHFDIPNESTKYGITGAGANGWFVYNDVLFIMLNTNGASNLDHGAFVKEAVALNPTVRWRVAVFHHTVYTVSERAEDTGTVERRNYFSRLFTECGIDIALSGHDHIYTRSHIMKGTDPITDKNAYDNDEMTSITDPEGVLYITANSSSGSKYYDIEFPEKEYAAFYNQEYTPNISKVSVDEGSLNITTYRTADMSVVDSFTINKSIESNILPFSDVKEGHWYYDAVDYVYDKGMMSGMSENRFGPNVATNRAMLVSVLWRFEGSPQGYDHSFSDVKSDHYFDKAVAWANANGIVYGKTESSFAPNDKLTREQMAAILHRYAAYKGKDTVTRGDLTAFGDLNKLASYAREPMEWAYGKGIITGMNQTTLDPRGSATRAQLSSILMRYLKPKKYFTLSFDDGITQDLKMIEIMKKYDVDCMTFNINTEGLYGAQWDLSWAGIDVSHKRFTKEELMTGIYDGFDVAAHTRTHPSLKVYDNNPDMIIYEVEGNANDIAEITGTKPVGMAWPGGDAEYTDTTIDLVLQNTSIRYARGITSTYGFELPTEFMKWMPTCSLMDQNLLSYAYDFINLEAEEDCLFYVWGHGYELDAYELYDEFEALVRMMKASEGDIVLVTNTEFYELYKNEIPSVK